MKTSSISRTATKKEVAEYYGVQSRTVDNWMRRGMVPYLKLGGKLVRFDLVEVHEALKAKCGRNSVTPNAA